MNVTGTSSTREQQQVMAETCRIVVVGAHKLQLQKVMSLLVGEPHRHDERIRIEYLPCVATFNSYTDEENGVRVRYLESVEYCADLELTTDDSEDSRPRSLLELFDQLAVAKPEKTDDGSEASLFRGIAGAAVGSGIEGEGDVSLISKYFHTMMNVSDDSDDSHIGSIRVDCIRPNDEFATMRDELASYRAMSSEQKQTVTQQRTIGPGKMAKFVEDFAKTIVQEARGKRLARQRAKEEEALSKAATQTVPDEVRKEEPLSAPHEIDLKKDHFSCRKCRRVLFGRDDLQDPPHVPAQHGFGYRKHGVELGESPCQSHFLQECLDWMGEDILQSSEGKFSCPKCHTKLGTWHWSGAQCSCGTWVVPAIQIPRSKVDCLPPQAPGPPSGTIISPTVLS